MSDKENYREDILLQQIWEMINQENGEVLMSTNLQSRIQSAFKYYRESYAEQHLEDVFGDKETIEEMAHDYCFENYSGLKNNLDHIKEQGFLDGVEWLYDQQTTSQQQTIERLLEELKKPCCEKCGGDGFILVSKTGQFDKEDCDKCLSKKIVIKEADQLFNTTKPIDQ